MANQMDISSIKNSIPISEKYMLTIYEASAYFNIGVRETSDGWQKTIKVDSLSTWETDI